MARQEILIKRGRKASRSNRHRFPGPPRRVWDQMYVHARRIEAERYTLNPRHRNGPRVNGTHPSADSSAHRDEEGNHIANHREPVLSPLAKKHQGHDQRYGAFSTITRPLLREFGGR